MENNKRDNQGKNKESKIKWYFLITTILTYLPIYFFYQTRAMLILDSFKKLIFQMLPAFFLVYIIMLLTNYFINNKVLQKLMGEDAGVKGWLIAIITGIISSGPVYAWYPLMKDLQTKGIKDKFLAAFLYNRGIKLQWAPMLIIYFGWTYSIVLLIVMAVLSIPQGIFTEKLINHKTVELKLNKKL